jgi:hypothetical protein
MNLHRPTRYLFLDRPHDRLSRKYEARNPKQIQITNDRMNKLEAVSNFPFGSAQGLSLSNGFFEHLVIVSDFVLRISSLQSWFKRYCSETGPLSKIRSSKSEARNNSDKDREHAKAFGVIEGSKKEIRNGFWLTPKA